MIAISATSNSRLRTTRLNIVATLPWNSANSKRSVRVRNCFVTG
jgi:hypothetical protein